MAQNLTEYQGTDCLNCGTQLTGNYCVECGQRATNVNLSVQTLVVEFVESLFSLEFGFWQTFKRLAFFARFARANLLEALSTESIRAARSRGLGPGRVLWRHALGQAWIPFLTLAGLLLPTLVSGSVLIERIFAWPGLGGLMYESLFTRDYPTILGLTTLTACLVVAGTLIADTLYLVADPRLRRPAEPS